MKRNRNRTSRAEFSASPALLAGRVGRVKGRPAIRQ